MDFQKKFNLKTQFLFFLIYDAIKNETTLIDVKYQFLNFKKAYIVLTQFKLKFFTIKRC